MSVDNDTDRLIPPLPVYEREDGDDLVHAMNKIEEDLMDVDLPGEPEQGYERGLSQMLSWCEAMWLVERFGLSVVFDESATEWVACDPLRRYIERAYTPVAAILMWDEARKRGEG